MTTWGQVPAADMGCSLDLEGWACLWPGALGCLVSHCGSSGCGLGKLLATRQTASTRVQQGIRVSLNSDLISQVWLFRSGVSGLGQNGPIFLSQSSLLVLPTLLEISFSREEQKTKWPQISLGRVSRGWVGRGFPEQ